MELYVKSVPTILTLPYLLQKYSHNLLLIEIEHHFFSWDFIITFKTKSKFNSNYVMHFEIKLPKMYVVFVYSLTLALCLYTSIYIVFPTISYKAELRWHINKHCSFRWHNNVWVLCRVSGAVRLGGVYTCFCVRIYNRTLNELYQLHQFYIWKGAFLSVLNVCCVYCMIMQLFIKHTAVLFFCFSYFVYSITTYLYTYTVHTHTLCVVQLCKISCSKSSVVQSYTMCKVAASICIWGIDENIVHAVVRFI